MTVIKRIYCCDCRTWACRRMRATRVLATLAVVAWNVFMLTRAGVL